MGAEEYLFKPRPKSKESAIFFECWGFQANEEQSPAGVEVSSKCATAPLKKAGQDFFPPTLCLY